MKNIQLEQGTPEWHDFRRCHIGSSDAASIMGMNKYKSKAKLFDEKVNGWKQEETGMMHRGKQLEPVALAEVEEMTGFMFFPAVIIHPIYEWASASLDGLELMERCLVEIKCPGEKNHALAKEGKVPESYFCQMQHQLACTGLNLALYFSFDGYKGHIVEVKRDNDFINDMMKQEEKFWETIKDYVGAKNE